MDTRSINPSGDSCPDTQLSAEFIEPPARFVVAGNEGRLIPTLRDAASTRDPYQILARSAAAFFDADGELGNALADLAVTGRRAYCLLAHPALTPLHELQVAGAGSHIDLGTPPYTVSQLLAKVSGLLAPLLPATAPPAQAEGAINTALDRAFATAWALRGPVAERAATRAALGWIAVSGEDDMPHRPTNVPAPPFEQYELPVTVPAAGSHKEVTLQTRFLIASPAVPASPRSPHTLRALPPDPTPHIPEGNNVILFLHGHVSGAEEALTIIPLIHLAGLARGTKFSVVSVDLPNCGYSESFDHEQVATSSATQWPSGPIDREPIRTPVLDFIEDFVIAFVETLGAVVTTRFSGVIGGSLGGNLGLRLGRRSPMPAWLDKGIVSWNAASVWDAMVNDHIKSQAPGKCMNNWEASEFDESRRDYFHEVYDTVMIPVVLPRTQPEVWYRPGWQPCKRLHIAGSRLARREVYSRNLRKWHWRVAGEQLVFSHVDRVDRWDNTSKWRYELNVVKHLLIGSALDNFPGSNIYDATRKLADLMTATPGTGLFLGNTGHSVHFERPRFLAREIVNFLPWEETPKQVPTEVLSLEITSIYREVLIYRRRPRYGRITAVMGTNHTKNEPFSLTVPECIDFIDFGCDVFVTRADGGRTPVHVARRRGARPYIAANPDESGENNLLALGD